MKPSKTAFIYRLLGLILFGVCGFSSYVIPSMVDRSDFGVVLGMGAFNIFWNMSIDVDLYAKESLKK